jgi:hypothetical protein
MTMFASDLQPGAEPALATLQPFTPRALIADLVQQQVLRAVNHFSRLGRPSRIAPRKR